MEISAPDTGCLTLLLKTPALTLRRKSAWRNRCRFTVLPQIHSIKPTENKTVKPCNHSSTERVMEQVRQAINRYMAHFIGLQCAVHFTSNDVALRSPSGVPVFDDDLMTGYGRSREPIKYELPEMSVITKARCLAVGIMSFDMNLSVVVTIRPLQSYSSVVSHDGVVKKCMLIISVNMPIGTPEECLSARFGWSLSHSTYPICVIPGNA